MNVKQMFLPILLLIAPLLCSTPALADVVGHDGLLMGRFFCDICGPGPGAMDSNTRDFIVTDVNQFLDNHSWQDDQGHLKSVEICDYQLCTVWQYTGGGHFLGAIPVPNHHVHYQNQSAFDRETFFESGGHNPYPAGQTFQWEYEYVYYVCDDTYSDGIYEDTECRRYGG